MTVSEINVQITTLEDKLAKAKKAKKKTSDIREQLEALYVEAEQIKAEAVKVEVETPKKKVGRPLKYVDAYYEYKDQFVRVGRGRPSREETVADLEVLGYEGINDIDDVETHTLEIIRKGLYLNGLKAVTVLRKTSPSA